MQVWKFPKNKALCDEWMNQYPTISVSFSRVFGLNYTKAYDMLTMVIADLFNKHLYLIQDGKGTDFENSTFSTSLMDVPLKKK